MGAVVLAAHAAVAWWLSTARPEVSSVGEMAPITVDLIAPPQAPPTPVVAPPQPPQPVVTKPPTPRAPEVVTTRAPSQNQLQAEPAPVKPAPVEAPVAPAATPAAAAPLAAPAASAVAAPVPAERQQPKQLAASAVRYLVPPQVVYPPTSRRLEESGMVRLKVLVDERGHAVEVQVTQSSGYPRLDQAAASAMKAARFQPHLEGGVPRAVWAPATLTFDLEE